MDVEDDLGAEALVAAAPGPKVAVAAETADTRLPVRAAPIETTMTEIMATLAEVHEEMVSAERVHRVGTNHLVAACAI
jgi:hypothetical protein